MITRRIMLINSLSAAAFGLLPRRGFAAVGSNTVLRAGTSKAALLEDETKLTDVWAYNDTVPGPVIRAKKGEELAIEFVNGLEQATSVHWHGIRIENAMDGVSYLTQKPVEPGESFTYRFTVPDAGTYWYHPHNRTWEQLARGLYGALIVEGDEPQGAVDRDLTIVADDWRLEQGGALHEASLGARHDWAHAGRLGNILTLNGKAYERLNVRPGEWVRLRFINAANARVFRFTIGDQENWLAAIDGQPVKPALLPKAGITLAPAQRADLMVRVEGEPGDEIPIVETSIDGSLVAGYLVCEQEPSGGQAVSNAPVPLITNVIPDPDLENATSHELIMSGGARRFLVAGNFKGEEMDGRELAGTHKQFWAFNGNVGMSDTPFFSSKRGETVRLSMVNETAWPHSIHLHGHHFRELSRSRLSDNAPTKATEYGPDAWRDTVLMQADEKVEIAFVADNPGKWMLHCHMLEHQAAGMGTWYEVI